MTGIRHYADLNHLVSSKPGMFWCYTHLLYLPLTEQSHDPRYCQQCFEVLMEEAKGMRLSGNHHKPWWIPKSTNEKSVQVVEQPSLNMSTVNNKKTTVDRKSVV
jgi:hypothetical protein